MVRTWPGHRVQSQALKGKSWRGNHQIPAGFGAISAGARGSEKSGPCPSEGRTSLSWGREGFALKISVANNRIWPFMGNDTIFSGGRRRSHCSDPLIRPCWACPILSLRSRSQLHLCIYFSLSPGLLFIILSPPASTCFCHLGEAAQVPSSAPPGVNARQPMLLGFNGASSK